MRFVVFGAGAIGGVTGALLAEAGFDVLLVARGPHADAIERSGLTLETPTRTATLRLPLVRTAAEIDLRTGDVVLLAVKSQDTPDALDALAAVAPPTTPVACLQNGIANERRCLRVFERVHAVCVMSPTAHLRPGVVQAYSEPVPGILDVGRYPRGADDLDEALAAAFRDASFASEVRDDVMRWKHAKLLSNLANAVEILCTLDARRDALVEALRDEGMTCLEAAGIDVASSAEDAARRGHLLTPGEIDGARRGGGSTWQSIHRDAGSLETDYLNGEIVLLGRELGVPTPLNLRVQQLARAVLAGRVAPGSVAPGDLLAPVDEPGG